LIKPEYADNSIQRALDTGLITDEDSRLIRDFTAELRAARGISTSRVLKITYTLVYWRHHLGPFTKNSIYDIYRGIENLRNARVNGKPYKQNTLRDYLNFLKRFYLWLIDNGLSNVARDRVKKIAVPRTDSMTKTAEQLLTEDHIQMMIRACRSSRDRAMIAVLYEGGFRIEEIGTLTWEQVLFDEYGVVINVNVKTEKVRYVRLIAATQYLLAWRNDYPFEPSGEAVVFLSQQKKPLKYAAVLVQLRKITARAGIPKHITPHLLRHSRITQMIRTGYNESIIKKVMWGDINTTMFDTYVHLTDRDIDNELLKRAGITRKEQKETQSMNPLQCANCHTINAPTHSFCMQCGRALTEVAQKRVDIIKQEFPKTPEFQIIWELVEQKLKTLQ